MTPRSARPNEISLEHAITAQSAIVGIFLAATGPATAQGVGGFVEARGSYQVGVSGVPWQLVQRVRPRFEAPLGAERWRLSTTIEAALAQGATPQGALKQAIADSPLQQSLDLAGCTWPEPANGWLGVSAVSDYLLVDRLFIDTYQPRFDLRVGRQAVQWGSALVVNPTDPYPQVLATEPWRPRSGVNSARLTVPLADRHQVQAVIGVDDTFSRPRAAIRATANALQTDWSLVSAYREESDELLAGIDIKGTLGVGFWIEGALHLRELFDADEPVRVTDELALGVDYSLPVLEQVVLVAQYYRNGAGGRTPDDYGPGGQLSTGVQPPDCAGGEDLFGTPVATDPFAPFFAARNYGMVSVLAGLHPDVSVSATVLQNLDDGTGFAIPTVSVRPGSSVELSLSGQLPYRLWGRGGELSPRDDDLVLNVDMAEGAPPVTVDLTGLVPDATLTLWSRVSF